MEGKLLEYYNRELAYLREMGAEFAERYPKVAGRLGMRGIEVADPYVERMMEGVAFLTSRVQLKMDAEFPRFSQRLLEMIAPNYLAPTPSMAIAELQPDINKGDLSKGFVVPRGTMMDSQVLRKTASPVAIPPRTMSRCCRCVLRKPNSAGSPPMCRWPRLGSASAAPSALCACV
jgi:Uncharacterized protein conserved in bacteria